LVAYTVMQLPEPQPSS